MTDDRPPHRRDFVRGLLLTTGASLTATTAAGQSPTPTDKPEDATDPLAAEVEARMALIVARHGSRLDEEARASIRAEVEGLVKRARRLREIPLDNGDGPFPVFIPYRKPLA